MHRFLLLISSLLALTVLQSNGLLEERNNERFCSNIRSRDICNFMEVENVFNREIRFPNGCNMCRCVTMYKGSCSGGTCPLADEGAEDKAYCDALLTDIKDAVKQIGYMNCINSKDFCKKNKGAVYYDGCNQCFCLAGNAGNAICKRETRCAPFTGSKEDFLNKYCPAKKAQLLFASLLEFRQSGGAS